MYTPSHFKQEEVGVLQDAMERIAFASLVTETASGMVATQAPVLLERCEGGYGRLRGHIAKANSQWKSTLPGKDALAIFLGPNAYISPQGYASKREHGRVVPTWNYIAMHAYGPVIFREDRRLLLEIVTQLTEKHEAGFAVPWKVSDAPGEYIESMLGAIVAFELSITRIEASWKLSQNRSEDDRQGTMENVRERAPEVAHEMCKVPPRRS